MTPPLCQSFGLASVYLPCVLHTHKGVELLLLSSQVLDTKFLTVVHLQTGPLDQPLTTWRCAKLQTDAEAHGRSPKEVLASLTYALWPPESEPCSPSGAKGNPPSCSQILLGCLTCWQGISFLLCKFSHQLSPTDTRSEHHPGCGNGR